MANATSQPPSYAAEERAQHSAPGYCYIVQHESGTMFYTSRDRPISIANLPAEMGASNPQTFAPSQIKHGAIESRDRYEASSTSITVTVENDALRRYFLTAAAVKLKAWILRINTPDIEAALDFGTDAIVVQSGILGKVGFQRNTIGIELTPEPFYVEGKVPRMFFGRGCQHFLYGAQYLGVGCGLDKEDWKFETTIAALDPAQRIITLTGQRSPVSPATFFNAGHLLNVTLGARLTIGWSEFNASDTDLHVITWNPELAVGQTIKAYAGCALTKAACTVFGNLENFGGFADVPNKSPLHGVT